MTTDPANFRPRQYPPPEFPPRRPRPFTRTPPAIFPVLLGLLGLALAVRAGSQRLDLPAGPGDTLAGIAVALWGFGALAYLGKLVRRPGVILDDMKAMPARAGIAAGTAGGMAAATLLAAFAPVAAFWLLVAMLVAHGLVAALVLRVLAGLPSEGRVANPGWHLVFVGFIVGAPAAVALGMDGLARALFWTTVPVALLIWSVSAAQLFRRVPPAPLRPMLAIHIAPASLFATTAAATDQPALAVAFAGLGLALLAALILGWAWVIEAGFSPLWGSVTFPVAALAGALLRLDGWWGSLGTGLLSVAAVVVPVIAWRVLKLWPGNVLADRTGAAEA